jgi:5-aminopentanamidase
MKVKVAVVQFNPILGDNQYNLEKTKHFIEEASSHGAKLIVFPECSLTGYCFDSKEEAQKYALRLDDDWVSQLTDTSTKADAVVIVGLVEESIEQKTNGNMPPKLYNSLLVIGSQGVIGRYRKAHLPELGVDRFVEKGMDNFQVIDTPIGKIGPLICYDVRFPEQARILALQGADILVHITNIPITAKAQVDYLLPARANENRVFVLSSDRVGEERGFRFLGKSSIFDVNGEILAQADETQETIIYAELDLTKAREKRVYYPAEKGKPISHVNDLFGSRRPDLYDALIAKQ